jgi:thiol-disulfide isomerase/thioredoxin
MRLPLSATALFLLCSACGSQPSAPTNNMTAGNAPTAGATLSKDDPGYIAEDPKLAARFVGTPGPAVTLKTLDGTNVDLTKIYGKKPVYLKVWATYCIPCRTQMPEFQKISETYGKDIEIVAVNAGIGDDVDKVKAFVAEHKLTMPVAVDDGRLGNWLQMHETPFHVLIGRDGKIAWVGHQDGADLDAAIRKVLASTASSGAVETAKVESISTIKPGDLIPAIALEGPDGAPVTIKAGATGRPRAIFFSSTWCETYLAKTEPKTVAACRNVREEGDKLAHDASVETLGVFNNLWTTPKELTAYKARVKPQVPLAVDDLRQAFRLFGVSSFPAVALIGADGRLVRIVGPKDTDLSKAIALLKKPS